MIVVTTPASNADLIAILEANNADSDVNGLAN